MSESTGTFSVRVPQELKDEVDALARLTRRSRSFIVKEALARFVESEAEIVAGVQAGIEDSRAGRVAPHGKVMAEIRATIARAEKGWRAGSEKKRA